MLVQLPELPRHFAVAGHHEKQANHCDDGGVCRAHQEEEKNDADDPAKHDAKPRRDGGRAELLADKAEHILVSLRHGRPDLELICEVQRLAEDTRQRKHRPPEQGRAGDDFDCHRQDRLQRGARDAWLIYRRTGIQLHDPGQVGDRFRARERENHADKLHPKRGEMLMSRLEKLGR